jgi:hypothetical protein
MQGDTWVNSEVRSIYSLSGLGSETGILVVGCGLSIGPEFGFMSTSVQLPVGMFRYPQDMSLRWNYFT